MRSLEVRAISYEKEISKRNLKFTSALQLKCATMLNEEQMFVTQKDKKLNQFLFLRTGNLKLAMNEFAPDRKNKNRKQRASRNDC